MTNIRLERYDMLGVGLVVALCAWMIVSAAVSGGNPLPQIALLLAAGAAYTFGRALGGRNPVLVTMIVAFGIFFAALASGPQAFSGGPLAPPLGYANADGTIYALGVAAATMGATLAGQTATRRALWFLAFVLLGFSAITTSKAATALATGILLAALTARWLDRRVVVSAPLIVIFGVTTTILVALAPGSSSLSMLDRALTDRRAVLWQEALEITKRHPIFGAGPGSFAGISPTARSDADALWAHSAYLEMAADTGILGALLLGAMLFWVYGALYRSQHDPRLVVIGTAAATAFAVHAAIDYIAHFPAVVLTAAILVGMASQPTVADSEQDAAHT